MCPNNSNANSATTNESTERIPSIATPLIEMGFSAVLVQRAINALGICLLLLFFCFM